MLGERESRDAADRLLASIVRYSKDFIGLADLDQRLQFVNENGRKLVGSTSDQDLAGLSIWDLIHASSRALVAAEALPRVVHDGHWSGEISLRHTVTGDAIPLQIEGFRIDDAAGKPRHLAAVGRDVTESRRAETALRSSEERLLHAVRVAQIGIYDHDQLADTLYWSVQQRAIFGVSADEPVSLRTFLEHLCPEDRPAIEAAVRRAHDPAGDGSFDIEYRIIRGGAVRWLSNRGKTFFEGAGAARRPVRSVGAVVDVTERREAEEERTRLQARLAHAQRLQTVGRLAGGVAHDFNNMLHVIAGFAELIRLKLPAEAGVEAYAAEIERAAQRARDVTRQLLAFSRRQHISPRPSDLNALIAGTTGALSRLIGEDIELRIAGDESLWIVKVDPAQVDQILINLAVNARDAMPRGGRLTIETANVQFDEDYCRRHVGSRPGQYVLLAVGDDGIGMDEQTLSHVFEPFFTTKEPGKGTGLGLATVYGIVEQNGGFVNVRSQPGKGTSFEVYLPRAFDPVAATPPVALPVERASGGTVLVVEDAEAVRRLTAGMLESIGYTVVSAGRPDEAVEICGRREPSIDVVLTDVVMPGMSGPELRERLESLRPGIKVVFTSGYGADVIADLGIAGPGRRFIAKPFGVTDLARTIRDVLAKG